jgi:peptidoglycan lytic transglycosylase A
LVLAGCGVMRPRARGPLVPVSGRELPSFEDDSDLASLRTALERTYPVYARTSDGGRAAAAMRLLEILSSGMSAAERRKAIAHEFRVVRVRDPLLLTAYYEPELAGSLKRTGRYRYPLYARPHDLVDVDPASLDGECTCRRLAGRVREGRLERYPTRREIDVDGALAGRGLEVAWTEDPVQLAVLHVQGSGQLRLENGRLMGVRFAGTNGRPYTSLGSALRSRGLVDGGGLPAIRRALSAMSPAEQADVLASNERYTFFKLASGGAVGSLGVELTPGRSVATDPRLVPPGAVAWVETAGYRRFVVAQDAGAAIVGAHADMFLGAGAEAEERAGRTKERGGMFVVAPYAPENRLR